MPETEHNAESIGEQFKQAREAAHLTIQDISSQLHLNLAIIESLEADDFDSLPGPTYVKGYIRGYAKTLKLDAEQLIEQYNRLSAQQKAPEILPKVFQQSQISSRDKPVKLATYLLSFGLVILLLIWWQGRNVIIPINHNMETEESAETQASASAAVPPAFDYEFLLIDHNAPVVEDSILPISSATALPEAVLDISDLPAADEQTSEHNRAVESTPIADDSHDSVIAFSVNQNSWIEVKDAHDKPLYLNIAKAGESFELRGEAPIQIILGNAPGVTVKFQGNEFDTSPYERAGVARFILE